MKKLIAATVAFIFVSSAATPAQASDTCNTIIVSLCVGGSGPSLPNPQIIPQAPTTAAPTPTPASTPAKNSAVNTQPQTTAPAPAPQQETPGAKATGTVSQQKNNTPDKVVTTPTSGPVSQNNTAPGAAPEVKTKVETKYVTTPAKWKLPVGILLAAMVAVVLVMYGMYRRGSRVAETKFNDYIVDVMYSARRKRKKSPRRVDARASAV